MLMSKTSPDVYPVKLVSLNIVYFDQCLGAAHPKRWSKYVILTRENLLNLGIKHTTSVLLQT